MKIYIDNELHAENFMDEDIIDGLELLFENGDERLLLEFLDKYQNKIFNENKV